MPDYADEQLVRIEAMDFTWVLPWAKVKADVESGFAVLLEAVEQEPGG